MDEHLDELDKLFAQVNQVEKDENEVLYFLSLI
jgi:hypothetical protein